jgi:hypothetical protein
MESIGQKSSAESVTSGRLRKSCHSDQMLWSEPATFSGSGGAQVQATDFCQSAKSGPSSEAQN